MASLMLLRIAAGPVAGKLSSAMRLLSECTTCALTVSSVGGGSVAGQPVSSTNWNP